MKSPHRLQRCIFPCLGLCSGTPVAFVSSEQGFIPAIPWGNVNAKMSLDVSLHFPPRSPSDAVEVHRMARYVSVRCRGTKSPLLTMFLVPSTDSAVFKFFCE